MQNNRTATNLNKKAANFFSALPAVLMGSGPFSIEKLFSGFWINPKFSLAEEYLSFDLTHSLREHKLAEAQDQP